MNRKTTLLLTVGLVILSINISYAATTLMEIGRSPFHKPPLTSVADLHTMMQSNEADIQQGFDMAGNGELFEPFMTQVQQAQIEEVQVQQGTYFQWMLFKKKGNGAVRVKRDVTWGNTTPFTAYQFDVKANGQRYSFVVPLGCGNIALMDVSILPVAAAPNQSPQCDMTVSTTSGFCGDPITIDASASSDSDGSVTKMTVTFADDQGQTVSEEVVEGGLVAETSIPCGTNTMTVTVIDNEGLTGTSPACTQTVIGKKRFGFLADAGYYHQFDPGHYFFVRAGGEYKFTDQWSILGLVGIAPQFDGDDGETAFTIDVLGEYSFASRYFINLGVGGWITDGDSDIEAEDSQVDLIAAFGARIFGEPDSFNTSLFIEARSGFDELDDLDKYGRYGVGLRFRF